MRPLYGHDRAVADWAGKELGTVFVEPFTTIGIIDKDGTLKGAAIFNGYTGPNIELTAVGKAAWSKQACEAVCKYAFIQLGCARMSVTTRASNELVLSLCKRHGFKTEGLIRRLYGDEDGIILGMLKQECRWISDEIPQSPRRSGPQGNSGSASAVKQRDGDCANWPECAEPNHALRQSYL